MSLPLVSATPECSQEMAQDFFNELVSVWFSEIASVLDLASAHVEKSYYLGIIQGFLAAFVVWVFIDFAFSFSKRIAVGSKLVSEGEEDA